MPRQAPAVAPSMTPMRLPPDYLHRPLLVEHACTCALCAAPLRWIERFTPARFAYFVDDDGRGLQQCPGCGQRLDRALRAGAILMSGIAVAMEAPASIDSATDDGDRPRPVA